LEKPALENAIAFAFACVMFAYLFGNISGTTAYFAKQIAIAEHQVSMCDRYATANLSQETVGTIAAKFKECLKEF
jgi:hypothetical protein